MATAANPVASWTGGAAQSVPRAAARVTRAQLLRAGSSLVLTGAVPITLAACGGSADTAAGPAAISARPVSLVLNTSWVGGVRGQVVDQGLAEYKRRFPQVTVTIAPLGGDNATLTALMAADSIGDVAQWDHKLIV